jgi:3-oxoacyl-[acyl-carrier protein] reductase
MSFAAIALGSNLGDRGATLAAAVRRLRAEPGLRVLAVSRFYETAPINCPPGSPSYLNAALTCDTYHTPETLLELLQRIERQFGRVRSEVNAPRTLDLDLLLYDQAQRTTDPIVPHPRMHERAFVLVPLAQIAPEAIHPGTGKRIRELVDALPAEDRYALEKATDPRAAVSRSLAGLRALITGSTSGIGWAIADAFVNRGADVITHGRREGPGRHLAANLREAADVDRLAKEAWTVFPEGLDVLVCNAGADTLTGDAAKWSFDRKLDELFAVDLKGTMRLSRAIGARMKDRGRGLILTVGWDQAEAGMAGDSGELFAAVKGAIMAFTRSLSLSLAPAVRVNCLAPGWIRTAWGESASKDWQERVRRETPLGVWGLPEDVAAAAVWLASPEAAFQTGQTIHINGGAVR